MGVGPEKFVGVEVEPAVAGAVAPELDGRDRSVGVAHGACSQCEVAVQGDGIGCVGERSDGGRLVAGRVHGGGCGSGIAPEPALVLCAGKEAVGVGGEGGRRYGPSPSVTRGRVEAQELVHTGVELPVIVDVAIEVHARDRVVVGVGDVVRGEREIVSLRDRIGSCAERSDNRPLGRWKGDGEGRRMIGAAAQCVARGVANRRGPADCEAIGFIGEVANERNDRRLGRRVARDGAQQTRQVYIVPVVKDAVTARGQQRVVASVGDGRFPQGVGVGEVHLDLRRCAGDHAGGGRALDRRSGRVHRDRQRG